jgi:hypothetical protein
MELLLHIIAVEKAYLAREQRRRGTTDLEEIKRRIEYLEQLAAAQPIQKAS